MIKTKLFACLALPAILSVTIPGTSRCAELDASLAAVGAKAAGGRAFEAFEEIKRAELELWRTMPGMAARRAVLVEEEPAFFGSYTPKAGGAYRPGEPVYLYIEPVGYTIRESGEEYSFSLKADFTLVDGDGQILGGQRDFGRWEMSGRRPVTEFMMFFTFDFEGLPAGNYTIETLIMDTLSNRTLEVDLPITIVGE